MNSFPTDTTTVHEGWWILGGYLGSVATAVVWSVTLWLAPHSEPTAEVLAYSNDAAGALTTGSLVGAGLLVVGIAVLAIYHDGVE